MAVLKCKMCGGTLEVHNNESVTECEYCGTKQTLPTNADEVITNLFNRANNLRMKCEFDKAMQIYEKIVEKDDSEAEAHWGIVLCKYGIEYVEDPQTMERIPTCHRTSFEPITKDVDYIAAIDYSDSLQQVIYEKEARAIDKIQKNILAVVNNEEPFDIFICYKETDDNGKRTVDSVIANDIYHQLTQEGFKVFYAAITLEDKLGREYEPYIFAALNSAKVMLVIGTKSEYFNAVWVKNEWSRFMNFMKIDSSKLLIPCYRDMDAYDLPEEFAHLQAQDMSKIGFINDVVRGIKKVLKVDGLKSDIDQANTVSNMNVTVETLLERAFLFLEDEEWKRADEFCEQVLNQDPKNAYAYLGKLMSQLRVRTKERLKELEYSFKNNNNYQKILRFGNDELKLELTGYIEDIEDNNDKERIEGIYTNARTLMNSAISQNEYKEAGLLFETITDYKDAKELAKECAAQADSIEKRIEPLLEEYRLAYRSEGEKTQKKKEIKNQVAVCKRELNVLTELIKDWKQIEEELASIEEQVELNNEKIKKLNAEKEELGLFAMKQKKDIQQEISDTESKVYPLNQTKRLLRNRQQGFDSLDEVHKEYESTKQKINVLDEEYDELEKKKTRDGIRQELNQYGFGAKRLYHFLYNSVQVGQEIDFGAYQQKKDAYYEEEDIEWIVLDKKDDKILVISKYALDFRPYHIFQNYITWEKCALREWLNHAFLKTAFTEEEEKMISSVKVAADENPRYNMSAGNATYDQVFLLSINEINKYMYSAESRICQGTEYAISKENNEFGVEGNICWWWLRTPGGSLDGACSIMTQGFVNDIGTAVTANYCAIRPAMWIDLNIE